MSNFTQSEGNASTTNRTKFYVGNTQITVAMCTISIAAVVFGLPGNILIIHAVRSRKKMQNARNYFIVSLACSDLVALLTTVPFSTLNFGNVVRNMPEVLCRTLVPTSSVVVAISVYTHVAIALERRRAIVFPLLPKPSPRRIKIFIAIIWLVPVLILSPIYYQIGKVLLGQSCKANTLNGVDESYRRAFILIGTASIFVIPLGVLTWSYRQIIRTLRQNTASIKHLVETSTAVALRLKNQRKVVNSLITLVCTFTAFYFPFYLANFLMVFMKTFESYFIVTFSAITLCIHFMIFSLNPIILYASSNEYRLAFNETLEFLQNLFCRIFLYFHKRKSFFAKHLKEPPFVIALSIKNKGCKKN